MSPVRWNHMIDGPDGWMLVERREAEEKLARRAAILDRYEAALQKILADAEEAPMEDMLDAGRIAREALDG